jgi:anaerobic magnesium-protoporphyrin IX monomethyl ester cyclase
MHKILLIKSFMLTTDQRGITPPIGLMSLAGTLRKKDNWAVKIVDSRLFGGDLRRVMAEVRQNNPDIVGISSITTEAPFMHKLAAEIKKEFPRTRMVVGGPHPSMYLNDTLSDCSIDYAVIGEGEETFAELLDALKNGELKDIEKVRGIAYRAETEIIQNEPRPYIEELDTLPFPAWDLVDHSGYARMPSMAAVGKRPYMGLFTSRACPYTCTFCHRLFGKGFRAHSPKYVLDMMEALVRDYKINEFEIYDDIFNLDKQRVIEICDGIGERGLDVKMVFPNGLRGDLLTDDIVQKMVDAGTIYVCLAIETASPRLQKMIKKNLNIDKMSAAMDSFARRHIYMAGFFMLGFPTETLDEQRLTVDFALRSPLHGAWFFIVTPFKGSELYKLGGSKALERAGAGFADHDYYRGNYNMSNVPDEIFFKLQRSAFRKFYLHPKRMYRTLRDHPHRIGIADSILGAFRKAFVKKRGNKIE